MSMIFPQQALIVTVFGSQACPMTCIIYLQLPLHESNALQAYLDRCRDNA
jgi:hypothetical protein